MGGSTFPSADEDMLGAEAAYAGMEADLQNYLDTYASSIAITDTTGSGFERAMVKGEGNWRDITADKGQRRPG